MIYKRYFFILFVIVCFSCQKNNTSSAPCPDYKLGTVVDMNGLDGCGFNIKLDDGSILEPTNLDAYSSLRINNQRIQFTYKEIDHIASICMVGALVEITCAEAIGNP